MPNEIICQGDTIDHKLQLHIFQIDYNGQTNDEIKDLIYNIFLNTQLIGMGFLLV